ncbi:unnamed protein product [Parascedosporium putredinis]|uniref:Uncharacterized protein n=1 Tax=Parascedosporium putredinis TaxID=1442378 RepID=A0A9P1HAM7_9PEZI|nr:unnamed protein product [Parascedosporium putredinis]CAI8002238.1 unnamed protein product [Parascedosporium putredinis]
MAAISPTGTEETASQARFQPPTRTLTIGTADSESTDVTPLSEVDAQDLSKQHKVHVEYLESLVPPSPSQFHKISFIQEERELEHRRQRKESRRRSQGHSSLNSPSLWSQATIADDPTQDPTIIIAAADTAPGNAPTMSQEPPPADQESSEAAAKLIQRTYREEVNQAAREHWKKAAAVLRRAGHDIDADPDTSDSSSISSSSLSSLSDDEDGNGLAARHRKKKREQLKQGKHTRMMALQYFLEMVDQKHRYGTNLKVYHEVWLDAETHDNFFHWLDHGEGRSLDIPACPRDRLERERVRYLSREERQYYLVEVDSEGRLCWAKNGNRIDTTTDFKDSLFGIVPKDDPAPTFNPESLDSQDHPVSLDSSDESAEEADRAAKYATPEFDKAKGPKKFSHLSTTTITNKLLRKTVRKNTWIFVADGHYRLYVGIKDSGSFQHSSFLQGSRIRAAGLIKIKDGRLRALSPLSGHYRPPASNFRTFVKNLKESGVDMGRVSISKSYMILTGLEMYVKTSTKGKKMMNKLLHHKEQIVDPTKAAQKEENQKDQSKSARREREVLEEEKREKEGRAELEKAEQGGRRPSLGDLAKKLHISHEKRDGQVHNGVVDGSQG